MSSVENICAFRKRREKYPYQFFRPAPAHSLRGRQRAIVVHSIVIIIFRHLTLFSNFSNGSINAYVIALWLRLASAPQRWRANICTFGHKRRFARIVLVVHSERLLADGGDALMLEPHRGFIGIHSAFGFLRKKRSWKNRSQRNDGACIDP